MISGPRFMSRLNQEKQIRTTQKKIFRFKLLQLGKSSVKMFHFSQNFYFVLTKAKLEVFSAIAKSSFQNKQFWRDWSKIVLCRTTQVEGVSRRSFEKVESLPPNLRSSRKQSMPEQQGLQGNRVPSTKTKMNYVSVKISIYHTWLKEITGL